MGGWALLYSSAAQDRMPRASEAPAAVELVRGSWGRGCGKPGVFRGRQSHPDAAFLHAPDTDPQTDFLADGHTEFFTDCWVDFLPDGKTKATQLQFLPRPAAQRGGRVAYSYIRIFNATLESQNVKNTKNPTTKILKKKRFHIFLL